MSRLSRFLDTGPRARLVFIRNHDKIESIPTLNISFEVARFIHDNKPADLKNNCFSFIKRIIFENTFSHPILGKIIYLSNIGVLFEPELGLDVDLFLSNISRNILTLIDWDGELKFPYLYFLRPTSSHRIKVDNLNYITI